MACKPFTEYGEFSVFIMKEYDSIFFVFNIDEKIDDYVQIFLNTEKLPYLEEFKKDLLKCFKENWNYFTTFGKTPDPYYEWIGDYLVRVDPSLTSEAFVILEID